MAAVANIVLVHGAWADGSSWSGVIPTLLEAGYRVVAAQLPLNSREDDIAATKRALAQVEGSTLLVGHSYGGSVITGAAVDAPNVVGLVYIAAFGPAEGENLITINEQFPPVEGGSYFRPDAFGYLWLTTEGVLNAFAADVEKGQAQIIAAVQNPPSGAIFGAPAGKPAWANLPSWYLVASDDKMIHPDAERWMAKRMGATTREIAASHVPMVSHPKEVAELILEAAKG